MCIRDSLKNYKKLQNLTEYWDYIKNAVKDLPDKVKGMVNLKPYKDLLELVQTVKAGSTAAAGLKGLDGMVESVRQLDRFLPPTTVTSPVLRLSLIHI